MKFEDFLQNDLPKEDDLWSKPSVYLFLFGFVLAGISVLDIISRLIWGTNLLFLQTASSDSARYLLSALVQSEAAILAVVITMSLVAVQLTASSYSARVIEIFEQMQSFWALILIYILVMAFESVVLKMITGLQLTPFFEILISLSYILSIFAFLSLLPYIWSVLYLLKPSKIIDKFSQKIEKETILTAERDPTKRDPFQPVIDIMTGALMRYDEATVVDGLNALKNRMIQILDIISRTLMPARTNPNKKR